MILMEYILFQDGKSDMAKLIVVSLSLQPILSLAVRYNLSPDEAAHKLSGMFILLKQGGHAVAALGSCTM